MYKIILLTAVSLLFVSFGYAQKEANYWYFGNFAGLNFNKTPVEVLSDGMLSTAEGCATISDKDGNLLFYTDGGTVWDRKHRKMPNGTGLIGSSSATQAALIVPKPGNPKLFYLFTVREYAGSLAYSIVDMSQNNGFGDITVKNEPLMKKSTEKITAVYHKNNKDLWVIAHKFDSDQFYTWLVTSDGLPAKPTITAVGSVNGDPALKDDSLNARGYLKASPDGSKLASAVMVPNNFLEVFDFDNNTGAISNPQKITGFNGSGPYGVEFSPNGRLLYVSEGISAEIFADPVNLYQISMPIKSGNIAGMGTVLALVDRSAIQCAPNGKIYVSVGGSLSVINKPDSVGLACDYKEYGLFLNPWSSEIGLPNFIQSYFREPVTVSSTGTCTSDITSFLVNTTIAKIDSISWDFTDKLSGVNNHSNRISPTHQFSKPGQYNVTAVVYHQGTADTGKTKLAIFEGPRVNFGKDTTLYYGQTLMLDVTNNQAEYKWNDGSTGATYLISSPGTYSVLVNNKSGCSALDTINVKYDQFINVNLRADTSICEGQTISPNVALPGAAYRWSDGSTTSSINIDKPGSYWVEITNAYKNRIKRDTINVRYYHFGDLTTVSDTVICGPQTLLLRALGAKKTEIYKWYDSSKNLILQSNNGVLQTEVLRHDATYYVALSNNQCDGIMHKINVHYYKATAFITNKDTVIERGQLVKLSGTGGKYYKWVPALYLNNPYVSNPVSIPDEDITYHLIVTNEQGCSDTTSVKILIKKSVIVPSAFTPNNDGINDLWVIKYIERFPQNQVSIYTRYGALIKNYKNYNNDWDGTNNGQPLPTGVYYYIVSIDESHKQTGWVTIIR